MLFYKSIWCWYSFELPWGCNLKTTKFLDCVLKNTLCLLKYFKEKTMDKHSGLCVIIKDIFFLILPDKEVI